MKAVASSENDRSRGQGAGVDITLDDLERKLTPKAAAQLLGLSTSTLAAWRSQGRGIPYYKIGNRVFYLERDVLAFLTKMRNA